MNHKKRCDEQFCDKMVRLYQKREDLSNQIVKSGSVKATVRYIYLETQIRIKLLGRIKLNGFWKSKLFDFYR